MDDALIGLDLPSPEKLEALQQPSHVVAVYTRKWKAQQKANEEADDLGTTQSGANCTKDLQVVCNLDNLAL